MRDVIRTLLALTFASGLTAGEITPCSTDDTECSCTLGLANAYKLLCDRISPPPTSVPALTSLVTELGMFRTSPTRSRISSDSLRLATGLKVIRIESCDIRIVEIGAFGGLYSLQTLNLANNNVKSLPRRIFSDLNLLQTLDLSYNSLESLTVDVFDGLRNLKYLDLSFNSLQSLPDDIFRPLESLKTLRLENTLLEATVLPDVLLSYIPDLELLNLNDNKLSQLQPQLLAKNRMLRELGVKGNNIQSISGEVFESMSQLTSLDIGENPFVCDCLLLSYKQWLDSVGSKNWGADATGYCTSPSDIQGQPIANLPVAKFLCPTTTKISTVVSTNGVTTKNGDVSFISTHNNSSLPRSNSSSSVGPDINRQHTTILERRLSKDTERSIIIGSCVGAAFLLILINVLILGCIRRAKMHTGTLKTKYIIRPDALDEEKESGNDYTTPYKQARVDGTSNGYIISNGVSGFYHTGSRSKMCSSGMDGNLYNPESELPTKVDRMLDATKQHNGSIFSIPTPGEDNSKNASKNLGSSYCPPDIKYTDNWQTPTSSGNWPTPGTHRVRFKSSNQLLEQRTIYSADSALDVNSPRNQDYTYYQEKITQHPQNSYYSDLDQCTDTQSQEFVPDDGADVKHSTGSGDSGVHSNSPCPVTDDSMSPSLPHRHVDKHMLSIHELDQSHVSVGSKKIRNETYV